MREGSRKAAPFYMPKGKPRYRKISPRSTPMKRSSTVQGKTAPKLRQKALSFAVKNKIKY